MGSFFYFEPPMTSGNQAYLLIGGNTGNRQAYLQQARELIEQRLGSIQTQSQVYETGAWGKTDQPDFLNQVLLISTTHSPEELITNILSIEEQMGRIRTERNAPRIIDIDILFYNNEVIDQPHLHIPHKEIPNRRFVLTPLNEIAPDLIHPYLNKSIMTLLSECRDNLSVTIAGS